MIETTNYIIERLLYKQTISTSKTIGELFNDIKVNKYVPFVSYNGFCKIYKSHKPQTVDWINNKNDEIHFYITDLTDEKLDKFESSDDKQTPASLQNYFDYYPYRLGVISVSEKTLNGLDLYFDYHTSKPIINDMLPEYDNITFNLIESRLLTVIHLEDDIELFRYRPRGVFNFLNQTFNKYLLADLIMNDPRFKSLSLDENRQTEKQGDSINVIYDINDTSQDTGKLTFVLTPKIDDSSGKLYCRINVSKIYRLNTRLSDVLVFKTHLESLVAIYNQEFEKLKKEYENVGLQVRLLEEGEEKITPAFQGLRGDCSHLPTYKVTLEDAIEEADGDEDRIMKFPRDEDPSPPTGVSQLYYICNDKKKKAFRHPGLTSGKNRIPCCYKVNQAKKENSELYRYQHPGQEKSDIVPQAPTIPGKLLLDNAYGVLPDYLNTIMSGFINNPDYSYKRKGVIMSPTSIKKSLLRAVFLSVLDLNNQTVEPSLTELSNFWYLAKQELYDMTRDEIKAHILDDDMYLDPSMYISLLEGYFRCNIYVFNKDGMVLPRFKNGYYKFERGQRGSIFLYENVETKTGNKLYDRIVLFDNKTDTGTPRGSMVPGLYNHILKMFNAYISTSTLEFKVSTDIKLKFPTNWDITAQGFDSYGKCRFLKLNNGVNSLIVFTTPLQPLMNTEVLSVEELNKHKNDKKIVQGFVSDGGYTDVVIKEHTNFEEICINLSNNVVLTLSTTTGKKIQNDETNITSIPIEISDYRKYLRLKRIARYIQEYITWLYIKNNFVNMDEFFEKMTVVDTTYQYKIIPPIKMSTDGSTGLFTPDGKLILNSNDMVDRLRFVINLSLKRELKLVEKYKLGKVLNYFTEKDDFDIQSDAMLIQGLNSLKHVIDEYGKTTDSVTRIQFDKDNYFYRNKQLLDSNVYLVKNANSLDTAKMICNRWIRATDTDVSETGIAFYVNNNVSMKRLPGTNSSKVNIVVSRPTLEENVYCCLLRL